MTTRKRILFVEDEWLIRILHADALRDAGYEVVEAGTGDEGFAIVQADGAFDLLITDIKMPSTLSGLDLAAGWKERCPAGQVLISSAHLRPDRMDPADELITKPYHDVELLRVVERLIGTCQSPCAAP